MNKTVSGRPWVRYCLIVLMGLSLSGCSILSKQGTETGEIDMTREPTAIFGEPENDGQTRTEDKFKENETEISVPTSRDDGELIINADGITLEERICTPKGYVRSEAEENGLTDFLRSYPMKADGSPVLLYNGSEKGNQRAHAAVFGLPIEAENLQQCADSVMRVYAEYCWHNGLADKIKFHFTNGFLAEYSKWRDGYRISVNGNDVVWTAGDIYDASYEAFVKYMRMVFVYAGTLSMDTYESQPISLNEIQVGDVFLQGGSPGHVVMVVDVCADDQGRKAFLLGQGYMPAQEFHVIHNPAHPDDPWYYEDEVTYPFVTAEYTFQEGSLQRLSYLDWMQ